MSHFRPFDVIADAYRLVFHSWKALVALGWLPIVVFIAGDVVVWILEQERRSPSWGLLVFGLLAMLLALVSLYVLAMFAIAWHRFTLGQLHTVKLDVEFDRRARKFIGYIFLIVIVCGLPILAIQLVPQYFPAVVDTGFSGPLVYLVLFLAPIILFSRLSLVFPAIALDHPTSLVQAWRQSRGMTFGMFWIVFFATFPALFAVWIFGNFLGDAYLDGTLVHRVLSDLLSLVVTAIAVSSVSLAYGARIASQPSTIISKSSS